MGRAAALRDLREARRVFICYSHSDLEAARRLHKRIVRLRRASPADTVFLDQESLTPAERVGPEVVDQRLRESDLVVVVCGRDTPSSKEVNREITLALAQAEEGRTRVLPIILRPRTPLPPGLDYAIQGIFLGTLFPALAYSRWIAVAAALGLIAASGIAYYLWREGRAAERRALVEDIEAAGLSLTPQPGRHAQLSDLLQRAETADFPDLAGKVRTVLAETQQPLWITIAPPLPLTACGCGEGVAGAFVNRLVLLGAEKGDPWDGASGGGVIGKVISDPAGHRVLYEVEYESFADEGRAAEVKEDGTYQGVEIVGGERARFALPCDGSPAVLLGLSKKLEKQALKAPNGDDIGDVKYRLVDGDPLEADVTPTPASVEPTKNDDDVHHHLVDACGAPASLWRVDRQYRGGGARDYGGDLRPIYQVTFEVWPPAGPNPLWEDSDLFTTADADTQFWDRETDGMVETKREPPPAEPAALHASRRRAVVAGRLFTLSADEKKWDEVKVTPPVPTAVDRYVFAADGKRLIAYQESKSIAVFDAQDGRRIHTFVAAPTLAEAVVTGDGKTIVARFTSGELAAWCVEDCR